MRLMHAITRARYLAAANEGRRIAMSMERMATTTSNSTKVNALNVLRRRDMTDLQDTASPVRGGSKKSGQLPEHSSGAV
jgi:hypothetical protein